jgi:uncharacterized protein
VAAAPRSVTTIRAPNILLPSATVAMIGNPSHVTSAAQRWPEGRPARSPASGRGRATRSTVKRGRNKTDQPNVKSGSTAQRDGHHRSVQPPPVSSYISPKAKKGRPGGIEGRGLFAEAAIDAGEVVAVKGGHIVDTATIEALPERLQNSEVQIADGLHLVALTDDEYEPVMLFLNHSCEPNVGFAGNVVLVAMRDIEDGEELTTDYAMFDTSPGTMVCRCGSPSCRGTITGSDWRLPELQQRYASYFSWYVSRRIAEGSW